VIAVMNAFDILDALLPKSRPMVSRTPDPDPERSPERAGPRFTDELERRTPRAEAREARSGDQPRAAPAERGDDGAANARVADARVADAEGNDPEPSPAAGAADAPEAAEARPAAEADGVAGNPSGSGAIDDSDGAPTVDATSASATAVQSLPNDPVSATQAGVEQPRPAAAIEAVRVQGATPAPGLPRPLAAAPETTPALGPANPDPSSGAPRTIPGLQLAEVAPALDDAPRARPAPSTKLHPAKLQPAAVQAAAVQAPQAASLATPAKAPPPLPISRSAQPVEAAPAAAEAPSPATAKAAAATIGAAATAGGERSRGAEPQQAANGAAVDAVASARSAAAPPPSAESGTRYRDSRALKIGLRVRADGPSRPSQAAVVEPTRPLFPTAVRIMTATPGASGSSRPLVMPATLIAASSLNGGGAEIILPSGFEAGSAAATAKPAPTATPAATRLPLQAGSGAPLPDLVSPSPGGGAPATIAEFGGADKPLQLAAAKTQGPGAKAFQAPAQQVAVHISRAAASGLDRIVIRLHPADLGRVEVKLEVARDGRAVVAVWADKPETLDLLQRDARSLERALAQAGLRTDSESLSFNMRGQSGDSRQAAEGRESAAERASEQAAEEGVDDLERALLAAGAGAAYGAQSQALDIRV
jgi:flagellar hook-length control protein FliK